MNRVFKSFGRHLSCLTSLAGRMPAGIVVCMLAVAGLFAASTPAQAQSQENLVDRVSKAVGVSLPDEYQAKMVQFVGSSKILQDEDAATFTEQFIQGQMKENWGISKQNQLLFVWDAIYEQIFPKKNIYTGEDGNKQRLEDLENAWDHVEACGKKYTQEFRAYMNKITAETDQSIKETDQSIKITNYGLLITSIMSYELRNGLTESDLKELKEIYDRAIKRSKELNINYHALLPLEVQRFYDIEPTSQQNTLTCEKAAVQLLNITLDEIIKLYNLYQKAPNAERKKRDIKNVIERCQKYKVDYKSKLTPEILRYFGVE